MGLEWQHSHSTKTLEIWKFLIVVTFISVLFSNCTEPPKGKTKAEVIQERLFKKVDVWRKSVEDKCRRDVMAAATRIVDSTLIANARARKEREANRPSKPRKPGQPEVEIPIDTTPIAPLILLEFLLSKDSAYIDSLLSSDTIELELLQLLEQDSIWLEEIEKEKKLNKTQLKKKNE